MEGNGFRGCWINVGTEIKLDNEMFFDMDAA